MNPHLSLRYFRHRLLSKTAFQVLIAPWFFAPPDNQQGRTHFPTAALWESHWAERPHRLKSMGKLRSSAGAGGVSGSPAASGCPQPPSSVLLKVWYQKPASHMALLLQGSPVCHEADGVIYTSPDICLFPCAWNSYKSPSLPLQHLLCQLFPIPRIALPWCTLTLVRTQSHLHFFSSVLQFVMFALHAVCVLQHIWLSSHHYTAPKLCIPNLCSAIHAINKHISWQQNQKGSQGTRNFISDISLFSQDGKCWCLATLCLSANSSPRSKLIDVVELWTHISHRPHLSASHWALWVLLLGNDLFLATSSCPYGSQQRCWRSSEAFCAAKGVRNFVLPLYPALPANSCPPSNDLFQASGVRDTKTLLFLPCPLSI